MGQSLDSVRPIMSPSVRNPSARNSACSEVALAIAAIPYDEGTAMQHISTNLDRLENVALLQQRVELSDKKMDKMNMLAVGAKLDRALRRRMVGQDAEMRPRSNLLMGQHKLVDVNDLVPVGSI